MGYKEKLPCELIEEILSRVPPTSLARFKLVAKQWKSLFEDKFFINNHKMTSRFILTTKSKIYSVSINPKLEVNELALGIPGLKSQRPRYLVDRNEFLLCRMEKGVAIWNPWLNQTRWIEDELNQDKFVYTGILCKNGSYMVLGYLPETEDTTMALWKIYDLASDAWKDHVPGSSYGKEGPYRGQTIFNGSVSLHGNLYWVSYYETTGEGWCIAQFEVSSNAFYGFCDLPCGKDHRSNAYVLAIFKEDRFSLLKQCHATKKIEVWVTKNKINSRKGGDVEWIKFMEVSSPDLPVLGQPGSNLRPSYFIEDKTLVVCFCENGRAWIYFLRENKLIHKIEIDHVDGPWLWQYTYIPTLVQVPPKFTEKKQNYKFSLNGFYHWCSLFGLLLILFFFFSLFVVSLLRKAETFI